MKLEAAIIGNTFTGTLEALNNILESAVKIAAIEAVNQYKIEVLKDTLLSARQAAKYLNCAAPTIINYIHNGHSIAGKLPAISTGKNYQINKYDLELFKEKMKAKN